jgi:hypothetical protein
MSEKPMFIIEDNNVGRYVILKYNGVYDTYYEFAETKRLGNAQGIRAALEAYYNV